MVSVNLLGLSFDDLNVPETVSRLLERNPAAGFAYVVTPNADHIARLRRTPALLPVYQGAWLRLLDSHVISNLARICRLPAPRVASGADVTAQLLASLLAQDVAIIGFIPRHLPALRKICPHANFILHTPPMNLLQNPFAFAEARDFAVRTKARFTLIGLGSPLQELLAQAIAAEPEATGIGLCIGAALEFCSGAKPRAPLWMQRAGLEWFHRLVHNPVRLSRRYLIDDPPVLFSLVWQSLRLLVRACFSGSARVSAQRQGEMLRIMPADSFAENCFDDPRHACEPLRHARLERPSIS
jgi:N-acetylglucosaminyldiphosphoundecaprenol N-acetyl-beta-D-mannosaminyltransferase